MQKWIWRDLEFELPDDWEMLQFSKDRDRGRCAFADPYQFRMELSWRQVEGAPDFPRMMADYQAKLESKNDFQQGRNINLAGWNGLVGRQNNHDISRFGYYYDKDRCLVETVFLWPGKRDKLLEKDILVSFRYANPDKDNMKHWKAFGMHCRVPSNYVFSGCFVKPAMATMIHKGPKRSSYLKFQRFGMVSQWLKCPVRDWLKAQMPDVVENPSNSRETRISSHMVSSIKGSYKPKGLLNPNADYYAAAWVCPADGRLYHVENIVRPNQPMASPLSAELLLTCCPVYQGGIP